MRKNGREYGKKEEIRSRHPSFVVKWLLKGKENTKESSMPLNSGTTKDENG
jgi:hypothetical protein